MLFSDPVIFTGRPLEPREHFLSFGLSLLSLLMADSPLSLSVSLPRSLLSGQGPDGSAHLPGICPALVSWDVFVAKGKSHGHHTAGFFPHKVMEREESTHFLGLPSQSITD